MLNYRLTSARPSRQIHSIYKKRLHQISRAPRLVERKSFIQNIEYQSYLIGKGVILFTFFYCSLNWMHYRNLRRNIEKREEENDNDSS